MMLMRTQPGTKNTEIREQPAYTVAEGARYLKLPVATLRSWVAGRSYPKAGDVFLEQYGKLISLNASGQLAMRKVFEEHLKRVEWDQWQFPVRLYPFVSGEAPAQRPIAIDPSIAFGRPVLLRAGVSTGAIADRIDAGESVTDLAEDYGLTP
jgi:hypothetical protein